MGSHARATTRSRRGIDTQFPAGKEPCQLMACLLAECNELAQQVNHTEDTGLTSASLWPMS